MHVTLVKSIGHANSTLRLNAGTIVRVIPAVNLPEVNKFFIIGQHENGQSLEFVLSLKDLHYFTDMTKEQQENTLKIGGYDLLHKP